MKNKKYILFCLFLLYLAPAKASDITKDENKYVTISGTVKDKSDKRALSYANVSIAGSTASTCDQYRWRIYVQSERTGRQYHARSIALGLRQCPHPSERGGFGLIHRLAYTLHVDAK